jgi:prepilin-type N-terminal cleavage/methylation domain-containing protein
MPFTHRTTTPPARRRAGFTLTELMVVILIISVLMAIAAGTLFNFMGSQQATNTQKILDRVQVVLNSRWSTVTRLAKDEPIPAAVQSYLQGQNPQGLNYVGMDTNAPQRMRVLYIKLRQRQEFPMSFAEALRPDPLPPLAKFTSFFQSLGYTSTPASQPDVESAVLLLLALQSNQSGGGVSQDALGRAAVGPVQLSAGLRVDALVDGWGKPLALCRWPAGSPLLNPNGAAPGPSRDPTDPNGFLMNAAWLSSIAVTEFLFPLNYPKPPLPGRICIYHQPAPPGQSFRLAPLVASAGPDQSLSLPQGVNYPTLNYVMGLDRYTFKPVDATAYDNLYSKPQ